MAVKYEGKSSMEQAPEVSAKLVFWRQLELEIRPLSPGRSATKTLNSKSFQRTTWRRKK